MIFTTCTRLLFYTCLEISHQMSHYIQTNKTYVLKYYSLIITSSALAFVSKRTDLLRLLHKLKISQKFEVRLFFVSNLK